MARLNFNSPNKKRIELGVSRGMLYPRGKAGVIWNGITSISENSSGAEAIDLYADDMKYGSFRSAEKYEATIEAYTYPDEFEECDGSVVIANGVKIGQQTRLPFDFCFRTEIQNGSGVSKNDGYKIHLIYNATASPTEKSYETINDSPSAITFSWDLQTNPFVIEGMRSTASIIIDSTQIDRIKLEELEKILYGTGDLAPRMPSPIEVISLIQRLDVKRIFMDIVSRYGLWKWDTFNFKTDTVPIAIDRESESRIYYDPESGTEYSIPAIAYTLLEINKDRRKYMVIVIDDNDSSDLANTMEEELQLVIDKVTHSGDLYYYQYHYYV